MALRVTARRAQRLGTSTPSQGPGSGNSGLLPSATGPGARRCKAKWGVLATGALASTAWNCCRDRRRGITGARRPASSVRQALATLGAAGVDDRADATRVHAHEETMGPGAADLGGLISAFRVGPVRNRGNPQL